MRTNYLLFLTFITGFFPVGHVTASTSSPDSTACTVAPLIEKVMLYSPYTQIVVSPGASVNYTVDLINKGTTTCNENISVEGLPSSWEYEIKSGGWNIKKLAVLPGEQKNFTLTVNVPLRVNRGNYNFRVAAGDAGLPLTLVVSKQGTYQSEFTTDQPSMQGNSGSNFNFNATLQNQTSDQQLYALMADAPRGWNVIFKPNHKQATSAQIDPNASQNIAIEIKPAPNVEAGKYEIPVRAVTNSTSADLRLEVEITGTFQMELTTPTGQLSADITAGDAKRIDIEIKNTGSSELKDIELTSRKPSGWELTFEPAKIESLRAGASANVVATLKASPKALPGDYVVNMDAKTSEVNANAQFRMTVKTPALLGWIGVTVILAVIGGVYLLFRKYGRR